MMDAPPSPLTGSRFSSQQRDELKALLRERSLIQGAVTLSKGQQSSFYFDCKRVTLSARGASLVADAFLAAIEALPEKPHAIGGLTHGADPIVGAVQMRALERGVELDGFYVRKEPKAHGTRQLIENPPPTGSKVVLVEDVVTTGSSIELAGQRIREHGCDILAAICLIDRNPGGSAALRKVFPRYASIYSIEDFMKPEDVAKLSSQA